MGKRDSLTDRLWQKVVKSDDPDGCWLWTGPTDYGYGRIGFNYRRLVTHRVAYELLVGPIPEGMELDHLCRVPACCNPAHLEPVTRKENILRSDGLSARLARRTACANGHDLTEDNVQRRGGTRICLTCKRKFSHANAKERRSAVGVRVRHAALHADPVFGCSACEGRRVSA